MNPLLAPGVSLMRRLTYPQRLGALALCLAALLCVVGYAVRELTHNLIDFAARERLGVRLLMPAGELHQLAHALAEARRMDDGTVAQASLDRARELLEEMQAAART